MEHCRDVSVRNEIGAITRAYGHVNEWGLSYVERFRNSDSCYIGPVKHTISAVMMHGKHGGLGPIFRQWLSWDEGDSSHLKFGWITDREMDVRKCDAPRWFYEGQEVVPKDLAISKNFEAARSVRMTCAGLPGLANIALRSYLLSRAYQVKNFLSNDPTLWVPRKNLEDDAHLAENFLKYVCSGIGLKRAPFYYQTRNLTMDAYKVSPWDMYRNAGCMAEVMVTDFGKTKNLIAKVIAIIKKFKENPIGMCGISENELKFWLSPAEMKSFSQSIPWWFVRSENYKAPEISECFVTARRVDTMLGASRSRIPAEQLGFTMDSCEDIRRKMHRAETPPQKPPVITEVKPETIVVSIATPTAIDTGQIAQSA